MRSFADMDSTQRALNGLPRVGIDLDFGSARQQPGLHRILWACWFDITFDLGAAAELRLGALK